MVFGIFLLIFLFIAYKLLVEGLLWKIILLICGCFGLHYLILVNFPNSKTICFSLFDSQISWASVITAIILMLALANTKV